MPPTAQSPGTSSGRTTGSEVIARRARHEASLKCQALRQIDKKARERAWVDDYPRAYSARTKSTRSAAVAELDASPFRRGLQYLCDNFLPAFLTPKKKRAEDDTSPQVSTEITETVCAGASLPEKSTNLPLTEINLLKHTSGTPYGSKEDAMDEDIESSFSSSGTPTPVGRHDRADAAVAVGNDEGCMGVEEFRKYLQAVYKRVTRWQAIGNFEPPLEQIELPNLFAEYEVDWSSKKKAKECILYARLDADAGLYGLLKSGTLVRSCADTISQLDDYLYVEYLEEKFRERYGGDPTRRLARLHPSAFAEDPAVDPKLFWSFDRFRARFARYERAWTALKEKCAEPLTFKAIPWPLFNEPKSFADMTVNRVQDFSRFAKVGHTWEFLCEAPAALRQAAEFELNRAWRADVFAPFIAWRVQDARETAMILHCSGIVEGALQQLAVL